MDPATFIGSLSAAGAIIAAITTTVRNLSQLRDRFQHADVTIGLLIRELSTIKAALVQIEDFAAYSLQGPLQEELAEAFRVSLQGCKECLDLMADEVAELIDESNALGAGLLMRAKYVWNESTMRDHQQRLHTQISALQLLLQAAQIRSLSGQAALMRDPNSRQVIKQVKDDTFSVRAITLSRTPRQSTRLLSNASVSPPQSTIGSTVFSMDGDITKTEVYRRTGARAVAKYHGNASIQDKDSFVTKPGLTHTVDASPLRVRPQLETTATAAHGGGTEKSPITPITPVTPTTPSSVNPPTIRVLADDPPLSPQSTQVISRTSPVQLNARPVLRLDTSYDSPPSKSPKSSDSKFAALKQHFKNLSLGKSPVSPSSPASSISPSSPITGPRRGRKFTGKAGNSSLSIDLSPHDSSPVPALVRYAQTGTISDVEVLLDSGADTEDKHEASGRTALAIASHCGKRAICEALLRHGALVEATDRSLFRPLHLAASRGHYHVVECLLQEDADVDSSTSSGMTALHLAVVGQHLEVAQLLLGCNANTRTRDERQQTPLHTAVRHGQGDIVNLLLEHGADVDAKDATFQAPIHYAAAANFDDVLDILLTKRMDIERPGKALMTPLAQASEAGATNVVRSLIKKKASTKARAEGGFTALHFAAFPGHPEVIELLLQRKASIDAKSDDGRTPLLLAVHSRKFSAVELLLRKRANIEAQCSSGMRAIYAKLCSLSEELNSLHGSSEAVVGRVQQHVLRVVQKGDCNLEEVSKIM